MLIKITRSLTHGIDLECPLLLKLCCGHRPLNVFIPHVTVLLQPLSVLPAWRHLALILMVALWHLLVWVGVSLLGPLA
jgi:hypothetical protein